MAHRPAEVSRAILPARTATWGTRVFLKDLAEYLHERTSKLCVRARGWGILHRIGLGSGRASEYWVTEQGALRLIAHFRALQGAEYMAGRQFHEVKAKNAARMKVEHARQRAQRKAERAALNVRTHLCIAIPPAGTEDDSRGVCEAGGIEIAETPAVSSSDPDLV